MAAFDLEDQETLDELKAWWKQYGQWVKLALIGLVVAAATTAGWKWWDKSQRDGAGGLYFQLEAAFDSRDTVKVRELADRLTINHHWILSGALVKLGGAALSLWCRQALLLMGGRIWGWVSTVTFVGAHGQ